MNLAYVAGLFDGEGFVRIARWNKPSSSHIRYCLAVGINMTHRPVIEQLHATFGGGLRCNRHDLRNPNNRVVFDWSASTQFAAHFLRQIKPYLIVKLAEVELALEFQDHIDSNIYKPTGRPGPDGQVFREKRDEILAYREDCFQRMMALKHIGYDPIPSRPRGRPGRKSGKSVKWSSLLQNGPIETAD